MTEDGRRVTGRTGPQSSVPGLLTPSTSTLTSAYIEPLNQRQIQIYRRMTGEQRLLLSLDMIRSVWRIAADAIRNQNPGISNEGLKLKLKERRR
jgi:hypothetical protein